MILHRITPTMLACGKPNSLLARARRRYVPNVARRRLSSSRKPTKEEVDAALEKADKQMSAYYTYPVEKVIAAKKKSFHDRHTGKQFYLQVGLGMTLLTSFLVSPFLGRKIAYDKEFREKYVPSWYDYSIESPPSAWTREELNWQIMALQKRLAQRAKNGEFTPEKLDKMRREIHQRPEDERYAHFAKLHPGVDDDEDVEDE